MSQATRPASIRPLPASLVCPRCGTPASEHRSCPKCRLSLDERKLPTRAGWERQVLAAAQEFGRDKEPEAERARTSVQLTRVLLAALAVVALAVAVLVSSGESTTDRPERRLAAGGNLDSCAERWNRERTLRPDYASGAETAYVTLDAEGRCVVALPASASPRPGYATFVQVQGGPWGSYANYPPVEETRAAYAKALAHAKQLERLAGQTPNAGLRDAGTIILAD